MRLSETVFLCRSNQHPRNLPVPPNKTNNSIALEENKLKLDIAITLNAPFFSS